MDVRRCGVCVCIYIYEYYSAIKRINNAICCNMDGSRDYHTKWNKSKINIIWYHFYLESKVWYRWTYL